ncbi:MAG: hypothetical protein Rubg2KO_06140 [Rubricoccaceae bacterium]
MSPDFSPSSDLDPATLAALDGAAANAFAKRKSRLARVLSEGETGVQYESLALFAEPLFALYELDAADAFRLRDDPTTIPDDAVALMETARVMWAFFSLPPSTRAHKRQALASQLVGEDPSEDDWISLDGLIETLEIHWQALLREEIDAAQQTGYPTLGFDALLHHPAFRVTDEDHDATTAGFGSNGLTEVEARALFAQPLIEDPEVLIDPDAFDKALELADEYWSLAQSTDGDPNEAARDFARQHAEDRDSADVEREAAQMIQRYRDLFG